MNLSDIKMEKINTLFQRLKKKKEQLNLFRPLPKSVLKKLQEGLALEWTYNSNAIEGNSLTLRETQLVLEEGVTIRGKSLREHFEAKNHEKAIFHLQTLVKKNYQLNENDILDLHRLVLVNIEEEIAGRYRNGRVRIVGANFIPPNPLKVPYLMEELIHLVNKNPEKLNLLSLTTRLHHRLVWIHPFFDGNGRTARLVMNLWLMKCGYPPAVILKNDRKKYYEALNQANKGDYEKLTLLTGQAMERSLNIYLEACGAMNSEEKEYRTLAELAQELTYSQEYLSLLARRGEIDAFKQGRIWFSSLFAVKQYLKNRQRKR